VVRVDASARPAGVASERKRIVRRRGRVCGCGARCVSVISRTPDRACAHVHHHHRRPRRKPGRARRADARRVCLRQYVAGSTAHRRSRRASTERHDLARVARHHCAHDPRAGRRDRARLRRSVAAPRDVRRRNGRATDLFRGARRHADAWRGAAHRRGGGRLEVHRSSDSRALRPQLGSRRAQQSRGGASRACDGPA
jgi:hypothetical protein